MHFGRAIHEPGLAGQFGVMSIPMIALFKDGELVERADSAAACAQALRAQAEMAAPILSEFAVWMPLLNGEHRERTRPLADAVAARVRDSLAVDMRGFSTALRQFADRADTAVALLPEILPVQVHAAADGSLVLTGVRGITRIAADGGSAPSPSAP